MMENNQPLVLLVLCVFLGSSAFAQTIHKMAVRSDIRFRFATTEMTCVMSNDADKATELTFDVTLPKDAFIANFSMEIEGKNYPGNVKQKQEARKEYLAARRSGSSGGLVEQSARHSNKFDVSVNIAARSNVTFTLIYQELLRRRFGSYEYSVYIDEEDLKRIRDYSVEIFIQDRTEIRDVRTPAMRKEVISNAVEEQPNSLTQITNPSETTVYVVYRPSLEELQEQGSGWFVVQYDVDSDSAGDLLVVDGYFVHFFVPPDDLPPLPLDIVFVLDISGSMSGRKMEQLKDAMGIILDDVRETDRFNILLFDGTVQNWENELQEASESNVNRARGYVQQIGARGSTNLHLALMRGLELLQGSREASRVPMIFFLTDGEATAGEQDSDKIVADVSRKNEGVVNIYSLAFGAGADYKLLRQVSAKNKGFARKIYEASDAAQQVSGLYREISTIVIRELTVSYHSTSNNDGGDDKIAVYVDNSTVTICDLSSLYGNSDFVVAGRLGNADTLVTAPEKAGGLTLAVTGLGAEKQINFVLEENDLNRLTLEGDNPFWAVPRDLSKMAERTWAFLSIKQLLKEKVAAQENPDLVKDLDKQILDLSLKYHFVTPLTSMVVTRPEDNLKKNQSMEASFRDDEDIPAAKKSHIQASHMMRGYMHSHSQPSAVQGFPPSPGGIQYMRPLSFPHHRGPLRSQGQPSMDLNYRWMSPIQATRRGAPSIPSFTATAPTPAFFFTHTGIPSPATYSPIIPPGKSGKKSKSRKGKKSKRRKNGKKKSKKCARKTKVVLQSVTIHGDNMPTNCFELKASKSRDAQNYTLAADQQDDFSMLVSLKKKRFLEAIHIQRDNSHTRVTVSSEGNLILTPAVDGNASTPSPLSQVLVAPDKQSIQFRQDLAVFNVSVAKKTCRASFISVDVNLESSDRIVIADRYQDSIVGKAYVSVLGKSKKRKGKKRIPKGCRASGVQPGLASVMKGKELSQFRV